MNPCQWWEYDRRSTTTVHVRTAVLAEYPHVADWWAMLVKHDMIGVAYFYELAGRIDKHRYRFSVPFPQLTQAQFDELCNEWPAHEFYNLDRDMPSLYIEGDAVDVLFGEGGWTKLERGVEIGGKELTPFAVNLNRDSANLRSALKERQSELNLSDRHITKFLGYVSDELRPRYGEIKLHRPAPTKGERRLPYSWDMLTRLDKTDAKFEGIKSARRRANKLLSDFRSQRADAWLVLTGTVSDPAKLKLPRALKYK
jgi:hypothetical protein